MITTLANVSFGILALTPYGWLFMLAIIALEILVLSRTAMHRWWSAPAAWAAIIANGISGIVGFGVSLVLNGGWWLVVWMPWVSRNEVNWTDGATRQAIIQYYVAAFFLSVLIEIGWERFIIGNKAPARLVWRGCIFGNILSYLLGSVALYSVGFGSLL